MRGCIHVSRACAVVLIAGPMLWPFRRPCRIAINRDRLEDEVIRCIQVGGAGADSGRGHGGQLTPFPRMEYV